MVDLEDKVLVTEVETKHSVAEVTVVEVASPDGDVTVTEVTKPVVTEDADITAVVVTEVANSDGEVIERTTETVVEVETEKGVAEVLVTEVETPEGEHTVAAEVIEVTEVAASAVVAAAVLNKGHKSSRRRVKSRSHSSCSSCTTCAHRHGKIKKIHGPNHKPHKPKMSKSKSTKQRSLSHSEELVLVKETTTTHAVVDRSSSDIKKRDIEIVKTGSRDNSHDAAVHQHKELVIERNSSGDLEAHVEKTTILDLGSDGIVATKEVTEIDVDRRASASSSDIKIVAPEKEILKESKHHKTTVVTSNAPKIRARSHSTSSSVPSEDTIILMKKLERKIRKRTKEGSSPRESPCQLKGNNKACHSISNSGEIHQTHVVKKTFKSTTTQDHKKRSKGFFSCIYD